MSMPKGPLYKIRKCFLCKEDIENSRYNSRQKYCSSCLKMVEKVWDKKKRISLSMRFNRLKKNALRRGIEFTITYEQYESLVLENQCSYCSNALPRLGGGVDRKHFDIGYVSGNCISCCALCNDRKGKLELCGFPYERVLELLRELNQKEK